MYNDTKFSLHIVISIANQQLELFDGDHCLKQYIISTGKNGVGEMMDSGCTPRGEHVIRAMIGGGMPENSVFVGRRATGEIYSAELASKYPQRDWVLTRILWLSGLEKGKNRMGNVDSMRRHIYIHGCPDEFKMGEPLSHGCIRMRNRDIVELFTQLCGQTKVLICD